MEVSITVIDKYFVKIEFGHLCIFSCKTTLKVPTLCSFLNCKKGKWSKKGPFQCQKAKFVWKQKKLFYGKEDTPFGKKLHWKYNSISSLDFYYHQTLQTSKQKYIHHYSFWNWIFLELLILKSESFVSRHIIKSMHFLFIQCCYDLQITYSFKTGTYKCLCKISVKL